MEFAWYMIKEPIANVFGLPRPMLHMLFGAILFVVSAWLFRPRRLGFLYAWLIVLGIELLNEAGDAYDWIRWTGGINTGDTIEDILLTMLSPTILAVFMFGWRLRQPRTQ